MSRNFISNYITILLLIIIYGQFGFTVAAYYFGISHMATFFWAQLVFCTCVSGLVRIKYIRFSYIDILFSFFVVYVILNYILLGRSNASEFWQRIIVMCTFPYISGRLLCKYIRYKLLVKSLVCVSVLYIILIIGEIIKNPLIVLNMERPLFFATEENTASSNAFNLGLTIGSVWILAFSGLLLHVKDRKKILNKYASIIIILLFPAILFLVGSRTSIVTLAICVFILICILPRISWKTAVGLPVFVFGLIFVIYLFLPDSRREFIDELISPFFSKKTELYSNVSLDSGGSIELRGAFHEEAIRLFLQAPIFGIGSTNYGLAYAGPITEFASPHAIFTQVLAENGIIGITLLLILVGLPLLGFWNFCRIEKRPEVWHFCFVIFLIWVFEMTQEQFVGNIYFDYHIFLIFGLLSYALTTNSFSSGTKPETTDALSLS